MLSTILTSLQSLISPRFIVASFFPALAFWFSNALMLLWLNEPFRALTDKTINQSTLGQSSVLMAAALIGVAISAYALSAIMSGIQSLMEGSWPEPVAALFAPAQARHLKDLETRMRSYRVTRGGLEKNVHGLRQTEAWQKELREARVKGQTNHCGANNYAGDAPSAKKVLELAALRYRYQSISAGQLTEAVNMLKPALESNDADQKGPDDKYTLEEIRQQLWDLIGYAVRHAQDQHRHYMNQRRFSFGTTTIAPTRMGNVAQTIQSYAVERYDFNFELLWSRMQRVLQKDTNFGPILQAAKTQLDFLIASSALTWFWAMCWAVILTATGGPALVFFAVVSVGPMLAWVWYRAAVVHYRAFADVLRTSIDLFRFDLLSELHLPLPSGVLEERELWNMVDRLQGLYELHDLRYVQPKVTT